MYDNDYWPGSQFAPGDGPDPASQFTPDPYATSASPWVGAPFTEDTANNPNPERGFFQYSETHYLSDNSGYVALSSSTLAAARTGQGRSLVFRYFVMEKYLSVDAIDTAYLDLVTADINACRTAGVKLIPRFVYSTSGDTVAPYGDAPTITRIVGHLKQLLPIINAGADVIPFLEAGFIGMWGEWFYTDNFGDLGTVTEAQWMDRKAVLSYLLSGDSRIQVLLRYAGLKDKYLNGSNNVASLTDDFATQDAVKWSGYGTGVVATSGQLQISPTVSGSYIGITSAATTWDLVGHAVQVEVPTRLNLGNGTTEQFLHVNAPDFNNRLAIGISGSSLVMRYIVGGVSTDTTTTYDATNHRWWRLREVAGTAYWETSPTGAAGSWTVQRTTTHTLTVCSGTSVRIEAGFYGTEPTPGTAAFDNLSTDYLPPGDATTRLGFHNDAFLASVDDFGTYSSFSSMTVDATRAYVASQTALPLPNGGESAATNGAGSDWPQATTELPTYHFTFLNPDYNPDVLAQWGASGQAEAALRLGYRLVGLSANVPAAAVAGATMHVEIALTNNGYAYPLTPRDVVIVLDDQVGHRYEYVTGVDIRTWGPGPHNLVADVPVDPAAPPGTYHVALWLPDQTSGLRSRPEYAVRLANTGTWNATTGYNDLGTVAVGVSSPALEVSGFGAFAGVGPADTINYVTVAVNQFASSALMAAPSFELWDGTASIIGVAHTGSGSTLPTNVDSAVITGVSYAQLATLRVRIYAHAGAAPSGETMSVDYVSLTVNYTPAVVTSTSGTPQPLVVTPEAAPPAVSTVFIGASQPLGNPAVGTKSAIVVTPTTIAPPVPAAKILGPGASAAVAATVAVQPLVVSTPWQSTVPPVTVSSSQPLGNPAVGTDSAIVVTPIPAIPPVYPAQIGASEPLGNPAVGTGSPLVVTPPTPPVLVPPVTITASLPLGNPAVGTDSAMVVTPPTPIVPIPRVLSFGPGAPAAAVATTSGTQPLVVSTPFTAPVPGAIITASQPLGNPAVGSPQPLVVSTAWTSRVPGALLSANPAVPVVSTVSTPGPLVVGPPFVWCPTPGAHQSASYPLGTPAVPTGTAAQVVTPPYVPVPIPPVTLSASEPLGQPATGTPNALVVSPTFTLAPIPGAAVFAAPTVATVVATVTGVAPLVVTSRPGPGPVPKALVFAPVAVATTPAALVVGPPFTPVPVPGAQLAWSLPLGRPAVGTRSAQVVGPPFAWVPTHITRLPLPQIPPSIFVGSLDTTTAGSGADGTAYGSVMTDQATAATGATDGSAAGGGGLDGGAFASGVVG